MKIVHKSEAAMWRDMRKEAMKHAHHRDAPAIWNRFTKLIKEAERK